MWLEEAEVTLPGPSEDPGFSFLWPRHIFSQSVVQGPFAFSPLWEFGLRGPWNLSYSWIQWGHSSFLPCPVSPSSFTKGWELCCSLQIGILEFCEFKGMWRGNPLQSPALLSLPLVNSLTKWKEESQVVCMKTSTLTPLLPFEIGLLTVPDILLFKVCYFTT